MPLLARRYPEIFQIIVCLFMFLFAAQYDNIIWLALQTLIGLYVIMLGYSLWRESLSFKSPYSREAPMGYEYPRKDSVPEEVDTPPPGEDLLKQFETEVKESVNKDKQ